VVRYYTSLVLYQTLVCNKFVSLRNKECEDNSGHFKSQLRLISGKGAFLAYFVLFQMDLKTLFFLISTLFFFTKEVMKKRAILEKTCVWYKEDANAKEK